MIPFEVSTWNTLKFPLVNSNKYKQPNVLSSLLYVFSCVKCFFHSLSIINGVTFRWSWCLKSQPFGAGQITVVLAVAPVWPSDLEAVLSGVDMHHGACFPSAQSWGLFSAMCFLLMSRIDVASLVVNFLICGSSYLECDSTFWVLHECNCVELSVWRFPALHMCGWDYQV